MYSSVIDPKPHQLMTCPYNKAHQVEHYRMHIHLQKCRKQYLNCSKVNCPFDATHVINDAEQDFHVATCPKRHLFDSQKYIVEDETVPRALPSVPVVSTEENWEDEVATSYIPDMSKKGAHIITKIKGATPSERRKARMEGVKNYRAMAPPASDRLDTKSTGGKTLEKPGKSGRILVGTSENFTRNNEKFMKIS